MERQPCVCGSQEVERIVTDWEFVDGQTRDVVGVFCAPCRRKRGSYTRKQRKEPVGGGIADFVRNPSWIRETQS